MRRYLMVSLVLASACGEDLALPIEAATAPSELDGALAFLDEGTNALVIVDPAGRAGPDGNKRLVRVEAGDAPVLARSVPRVDDPERRQLVVVDPGAEQVLVYPDKMSHPVALSIGVPLEALDVSADGRWAIAYQPEGATPSSSLFAFPNTVAVVDLDVGAPRAEALRLGQPGARPLRAVFAEKTRLVTTVSDQGGPSSVTVDLPLALVFVRGGIVPVDLERSIAGRMVPLTPEADHEVMPAEVLFTNNRGDALSGNLDAIERAFVRSTAGELYVLSLSAAPGAFDDESMMGVLVALENVVTPDAEVYDTELFFTDDGNELLLAAAGDELILVDGYTGVATRFAQDVWVDTLVRFEDPATGDALALGYSKRQPQRELLRVDPFALDQRRSTGVETLRLGSRITSIEAVAGADRAIVVYQDGRDLGVLDLRRGGDLLDLRFARELAARQLSPGGERLWLVSDSPEDDAPHLAEVHLGSLETSDVRLDAGGARVGRVADYLWVQHDAPTGAVTFFPYDNLQRDAAISFRGILYTDLLSLSAQGEEER